MAPFVFDTPLAADIPFTEEFRLDGSFADEPAFAYQDQAADDQHCCVAELPAAAELRRWTDEELLSHYRDVGQTEAFDELVRRYRDELHYYLARYVDDAVLADDVLQNVFLKVHLKRELYRTAHPARPWLYSIATRQAIDALRRRAKHAAVSLDQRVDEDEDSQELISLLPSGADDPLTRLQCEESRQWVRDRLDRLPEMFRQTVVAAYMLDLKNREIAEQMNVPLGTVKSRLHLALAMLKKMAVEEKLVAQD